MWQLDEAGQCGSSWMRQGSVAHRVRQHVQMVLLPLCDEESEDAHHHDHDLEGAPSKAFTTPASEASGK